MDFSIRGSYQYVIYIHYSMGNENKIKGIQHAHEFITHKERMTKYAQIERDFRRFNQIDQGTDDPQPATSTVKTQHSQECEGSGNAKEKSTGEMSTPQPWL